MAGEVRQPIDVASLEAYLRANVPSISPPLDVKQFGFGQSNPTYQLTSKATGDKYVLRKKPPGQLMSKAAHKVEREHRILAALGSGRTDVPVPAVHCLCEDDAVLGTPFYIMEFLKGRIFEDPAMPEAASGEERRALWKAAVTTLARFHRVDFRAVGLASFGRDSGFYDRQLATWRQICAVQEEARDADTGQAVGPIPHFAELLAFFGDKGRQPRDRGTLVHGDYKIDNMVFHPTEPRVIGVLDWEMSTVGHPLSDLSNLLHPFFTVKLDTTYTRNEAFLPGATPGMPDPATLVKWYGETAGWDVPPHEMLWASAFNTFRASAILQGIAARVARRQASSAKADAYVEAFKPLGEFAWSLVQDQQKQGAAGSAAKL